MKFLNKKIPIGFVLVAIFVIAALVYSLGYKMAMDKFNSVVSYTQEKQKMYSTLSEVDYNVRKDYIGDITETNLLASLCKGYVEGLNNENCKFLTRQEYKDYNEAKENKSCDIEFVHVSEDVGCLRCRSLGTDASKLFTESLNSATVSGLNKIIIDLRNCENGNINESFKILQYLIPSGDIVSTTDKKDIKEVVCRSTSSGISAKLVVLVNKKTSGVSEIIVSALKDKGDVKIVGTETAGNAVREKVINLSDDTILIIPDAYYVTKSGSKIFPKGLIPDTNSDLSDDSKKLLESKNLPYDQDNQLQDAIRSINS